MDMRPPLNRRLSFWLIIFVIVLIVGILKYRHSILKQDISQKIPVVTTPVKQADMPIYLYALGTVIPTSSVTIKSQINGVLINILFHEGQIVKAGDLLAEIDSRPYQAQLLQYEGQLARDKAQLANALIDLNRYQKLWHQGSVTEQTFATQKSLVAALEGTIKMDEGLLNAAQTNLSYCHITSPINGRIGLRNVDPGNVVQTADVIATINTLDPITVIFSLPEDDIPQLKQTDLQVEAYNRQQTQLLAKGKLLSLDNQIDPTTGTIKLKAQFDNKNNTLFPNQFVNIRLLVQVLHQVTIVPTAAIQYNANQAYVYVLDKTATMVHKQTVKPRLTDKDTTVIENGLTPGQSVIIAGADRLTDSAHISLSDAE